MSRTASLNYGTIICIAVFCSLAVIAAAQDAAQVPTRDNPTRRARKTTDYLTKPVAETEVGTGVDASMEVPKADVPTPRKLQEQIDALTKQIDAQQKEITGLKSRLTAEESKPALGPPPKGYTRFFTTKTNWDNLSPFTGMELYARIDGR